MSDDQIQALLMFVLRYGFEGIVAGVVVFLLLKSFLPGYLTEKGKNLATQEDIAKITDRIESAKSPYSVALEELKGKHQMRLAAVESRLKAHQDAFTLWRELLAAVHDPSIHAVVIRCQTWWNQHCLYLEPEAREAFSLAYSYASMHGSLLASRAEMKDIKANWEGIMRAGEVLVQAVKLPGLTDAERKEVEKLERH